MIYESLYTILFIFANGPLKIYLELKEGKTSIKKMLEDYEDERSVMHERLGVKKHEVLPTISSGLKRRKDKAEDNIDSTEFR